MVIIIFSVAAIASAFAIGYAIGRRSPSSPD